MVAWVRRILPPARFLWLAALPWGAGLYRAWRIASTHVARLERPSYDPLGSRWMDALGAMIVEGRAGLLATAGIVAVAHLGVLQRPGESGARGWAGFAWLALLAGCATWACGYVDDPNVGALAVSGPLVLGAMMFVAGISLASRFRPAREPAWRLVAPVI